MRQLGADGSLSNITGWKDTQTASEIQKRLTVVAPLSVWKNAVVGRSRSCKSDRIYVLVT